MYVVVDADGIPVVVAIPDVDAIQLLQSTKTVVTTIVMTASKKINAAMVMKEVNHAAASKTENFVWMKSKAQAIKIMESAVKMKIIYVVQTDVPADATPATHALQYNNVVHPSVVVSQLAVIGTLVVIVAVIKTLVEDVVEVAMLASDHKDILNRLVTKFSVSFE